MKSFNYLAKAFGSIGNEWQQILMDNCKLELISIDKQLSELAINSQIYPPAAQTFNALKHTNFNQVKVVILGQDPYHGFNEANGLSFSVNKGIAVPPSLRNIFKELNLEYETNSKPDGEKLFSWADQGVLLLNSSLTVIKDQANSMANLGWQPITDKIIQIVSSKCENVVFILWGAFAQKKLSLIDHTRHLVLSSPHPSPLSAHKGFFGNNHFKSANQYLLSKHKTIINWL